MIKFLSLRSTLEESGWSIRSIDLASDCWWAKEIWKLESKWHPTDRVIYLSFLLDPLSDFDKNHPPDSAIWSISLSDHLPKSRPVGEIIEVSVNNQLEAATLEVIRLTASMRSCE